MKFHYMKLYRKSIGYLIFYLIASFVFLKLVYYFIDFYENDYNNNNKLEKSIDIPSDSNKIFQSCPIPFVFNSTNYSKRKELYKNLQCSMKNDLITIENGLVYFLINGTCSFECIHWKTDFDFSLSKSMNLTHLTPAPCSYFIVTCENIEKNSIKEKQLIITAIKSKSLIEESLSVLQGKPNDVIIIGIDSMSYQAFQYYLPKTYAALHHELNGVSFKKFNTMGDGTTVNLQAFLTGTKDTETYETRRRITGSKTVDNYNWIWNHYKKNGYVTLYAEDMTDYGTFQYRLNGFKKQPTDYYLRTPIMFAERNGFYKDFCLGSRPWHLEYFKFFKEFQKTYKDVPKFSFVFFGLLSHDDNKYVSYMDQDLAEFLVNLRKTNPQAMIVLYSDHGHRFNSRLTMQGKYEERLPFLGISLSKDQEHLKQIMKKNSDILITGLDFHATLEDVLGIYKPSSRSRHMSLFRELPKDRKCDDIESLPHWCSCLNWKLVEKPNLNKKLKKAGEIIVSKLTQYTKLDRKLCAELKLDTILSVYRLDANAAVLKFKQSADVDGFVPDLSDKFHQTVHWYRFTLRTTPGDALFDLTISIDSTSFKTTGNLWINEFRPEDISRLNRYAPWITCLNKRDNKNKLTSDIRKFCICKDVL